MKCYKDWIGMLKQNYGLHVLRAKKLWCLIWLGVKLMGIIDLGLRDCSYVK